MLFKKRYAKIVLLAICPSAMFSQIDTRQSLLSASFLLSTDYVWQKSFVDKNISIFSSNLYNNPCVNLQYKKPLIKPDKIYLGIGYRWKRHYLYWKYGGFLFGQWVETTHSFPISLKYKQGFKFTSFPFFKRITYSINPGGILNLMQRSDTNPLVGDASYNISTPSGPITFIEKYNYSNVNRVAASLSIEINLCLHYLINNFIQLDFGYGYNRDFVTLAKGEYSVVSGTNLVDSGSFSNKGTYRYALIGLSFIIKQDFESLSRKNKNL